MNAKPTLLDLFKADLEKAAEKAGCDLSKLEIESCYMDRTWGDRCGFFFSGEHAERAANWFYWWLTHKPLPSSYEAQRSTYQPEPWSRMVCKSNGATSHCEGAPVAPSYEKDPAEWLARFEVTPGFAVSHTYYPCAE